MERPKYIVIQDWMVEDYHLSGTELIVFALVYGFSQDGTSDFRGSASYVGACCGCTERTARNILHMLEKRGLVVSSKCVQNTQICAAYRAVETEKISEHGKNFRARKKFPSTEKISECEKNSTNDTSIKNINSTNIDSSSILSCIKDKEIKERNFPKKENKEKEKETNYDFVEDKFSIPFYRWLAYKRSIGSTYKNKTSLKAAYDRMLKLADYSPAKAEEIVEFSIANNYIGLFAPKDNNTNKSDKSFTYGNIQTASGDEAKYHSTI